MGLSDRNIFFSEYFSNYFQTERNTLAETAFLLIRNQTNFHSFHNQTKNCHHDRIPSNLAGIRKVFPWCNCVLAVGLLAQAGPLLWRESQRILAGTAAAAIKLFSATIINAIIKLLAAISAC